MTRLGKVKERQQLQMTSVARYVCFIHKPSCGEPEIKTRGMFEPFSVSSLVFWTEKDSVKSKDAVTTVSFFMTGPPIGKMKNSR